jgi:Putative phage tail protein
MTGKVDLETPFGTVAVYSLSRPTTVSDWLDDHAAAVKGPLIVIVNDTAILRADWNTQLIDPSDRAAVIMLPARGRGGIKNIIRVVATIGLAIAASVVAGPLGAAVGITSSIGVSLIGAGVFLAGSIVLNRLLPASTNTADQPQAQGAPQSPTYTLQAQGNYARLTSPIPKLYGNHLVFPDFASGTYAFFEPVFSVQLVRYFFCLGLGDYDVEQILIGDTVAWNSTSGPTNTYAGGFALEIVRPGAAPTIFYPYYFTSQDVGGFDLKPTLVMGPYIATPPGYRTTAIEFDFVMPNGLSYTNPTTGVILPVGVTVTCDYQLIDDRGNPIGPWVQNAEGFFALSKDAIRRSVPITVPEGRYQARVTRTDLGNPGTPSYISDISWTGLKSVLTRDSNGVDLSTIRYPDTTMLLLQVAATDRISAQSSHQVGVIMTAILPEWNALTGWSAPVPTRKLGASVSDMLRASYGAGLADARIDLDKLWTYLQDTWNARGDFCDRIFDQKMSIWEAMSALLKCGRTRPIMVGSKISFIRDEPRALYKQSFTPRNIAPNSLETLYILEDINLPDDVLLTFVNRDTWKPDSVRFSTTSIRTPNPIIYDYTGIGTTEHALREAAYQAANNKYRRKFATFGIELENRFMLLGDLIKVAHDVPMWGQSAPLNSVVSANHILADDDFTWQTGTQYYATLSTFDGKVLSAMRVSRGDTDADLIIDALDLATAMGAIGFTGNLADLCVGQFDAHNRVESRIIFGPSQSIGMDLIVTGVVPDANLNATIETVNEDIRVHTADGSSPVPPFALRHPIIALLLAGITVDLGRITDATPALIFEDLGRITDTTPATYGVDLGRGLP